MRSRRAPPPKPKEDPRRTPPDDEMRLRELLRQLGPRKPPKRVPR